MIEDRRADENRRLADRQNLQLTIGLNRTLSGIDLSRRELSGFYLRGKNLSKAMLKGARLRGTNITDANLRGAILEKADLHGARLGGADLTGAQLRGADLRKVNFNPRYSRPVGLTQLSQNSLEPARQSPEDLSNRVRHIQADPATDVATKKEVRLEAAKLAEAVRQGHLNTRPTDFKSADFTGADLRGADFSGSDVSEATFGNANLRGATAINTTWPRGFDPIAKGTKNVDLDDIIEGALSPAERAMLRHMDPKDRARYFLQKKIQEKARMAKLLSELQSIRHQAAMQVISNIK